MDQRNHSIKKLFRMKAFMAGLGIGMIGIGITSVYYQAEVMERDQRIEHMNQLDLDSFQWQWDREKEHAYYKEELKSCRKYMEGCYDGFVAAWGDTKTEREARYERALYLCRESCMSCDDLD